MEKLVAQPSRLCLRVGTQAGRLCYESFKPLNSKNATPRRFSTVGKRRGVVVLVGRMPRA